MAPPPQTKLPALRAILGSLLLISVYGILYQQDRSPVRLTDAQMMAILTTHCPALRQQPDVLGCLPDPAGIRLITDRPALMPPQVAGLPVITEPPPPHLPPPPGVVVLRPEGPDPQPTLSHCPPGYTEQQHYRWRFCNIRTDPQPIPTSLMIPPIAGVPYTRAQAIFKRQDFMQLPGVQSVGLGANGIVVQTAEPALIPSTFEGLPVWTEEPKSVPQLDNHTLTTAPSVVTGGVAIGPASGLGGGTLGGFVWSGGEPWLVTAAHIFPASCSDTSPCPPCNTSPCTDAEEQGRVKLLHECSHSDTNGISVNLQPRATSPKSTNSPLTRWTPLTEGMTLKAEVATGFMDASLFPTSRRLEEVRRGMDDFRRILTGRMAEPPLMGSVTTVSSRTRGYLTIGETSQTFTSPHHVVTSTVMMPMANVTVPRVEGREDVCNKTKHYQEMIKMERSTSSVPGTSGALVIDDNGNILGMHLLATYTRSSPSDTYKTWAARAEHIKEILRFDAWVGSETILLRGGFQVVRNDADPPVPQQLTGWAVDPLNPGEDLRIEIYAGGPKGTGTQIVPPSNPPSNYMPLKADQVHADTNARGYSGDNGFTWSIPSAHTGTTEWHVYTREDTDTTAALLRKLPELKDNWTGVSPKGVECLKGYEGFVAYPYDDADKKQTKTRVTEWPRDRDAWRRLTVGYGTRITNHKLWVEWLQSDLGEMITIDKTVGETLLKRDLNWAVNLVKEHIEVPLSQSEFDALAIFAYNIGPGNFEGDPNAPSEEDRNPSSVVRMLDNDTSTSPNTRYKSIEEAMQAFHHVREKKEQCETVDGEETCEKVTVRVDSPGLVNRRRNETVLFNDGVCTRTP